MSRFVSAIYAIFWSGATIGMSLLLALQLGVRSDDEFQSRERRTRTELMWQGWSRPALSMFFTSLERVIQDRIPFRDVLLDGQALFKEVFGQPVNTSAVILGKDGWLFLGNGSEKGLDKYRGLERFNESQLAQFVDTFANIQSNMNRQGIKFVFVPVPDKHSVYPDKLPDYLARRGQSPLDQLVDLQAPGLSILDLRTALADERKRSDMLLYEKVGSHWNEYGAYVAYREMMRALGIPIAVNASKEDFKTVSSNSASDLVLISRSKKWPPGEFLHLRRNFFTHELQVMDLSDGTVSTKPATSLIRVVEQPSVRVAREPTEGGLLVLGDSFTENISAYFNNSFPQVVYQHYRNYINQGIGDLVERFKPKAVVFMMVERSLGEDIRQIIPWSMRTGSALSPVGEFASQRARNLRIPNNSLIDGASESREIRDIVIRDGDLVFRATGFDPYFYLPSQEPMPEGAVIRLEITLPGERLVQLYYQTNSRPQTVEEQSISTASPAGRQVVQWRIKDSLNGKFRLDPGNAPGEYRIHKFEIFK